MEAACGRGAGGIFWDGVDATDFSDLLWCDAGFDECHEQGSEDHADVFDESTAIYSDQELTAHIDDPLMISLL